ncbi:unnamed protein product [Blumeria hordei]|uniref:HAUS augmin-like complex subunit 6 N-terminal domain-containing protein n=1 Tax=Blumeria hordei TaxID=2867405 RepID=A0A383UT24_BLUHO|nr:unnamed protein product [Blumeria hordei]
MSSLACDDTLARTRSIRVPPNDLKAIPQSNVGRSNVAIFLTNLRLLNIDQRNDWPDISLLTFSTKDAHQNQKKRVRCVEWALYQLFTIWDPEEALNKLQPFFPPLEPLQSLNLRTALFRCLDQARKNGTLGPNIVLRKTMFDECKGERLEELLAVFSFQVLKKALRDKESSNKHIPLAERLAIDQLNSSEERTILYPLVIAHRASLKKHLKDKEKSRSNYHKLSHMISLANRRVEQQDGKMHRTVDEAHSRIKLTERKIQEIQDRAAANWSGKQEWLQHILLGARPVSKCSFLSKEFNDVWNHVENGTVEHLEDDYKLNLLEQLNYRVQDQENRLAKWQEFGRSLAKPDTKSPSKKMKATVPKPRRIDLDFTKHQSLKPRISSLNHNNKSNTFTLEEYSEFITNLKLKLSSIGKLPSPVIQSANDAENQELKEVSLAIPKTERIIATQNELGPTYDTDISHKADSGIFTHTPQPQLQKRDVQLQEEKRCSFDRKEPDKQIKKMGKLDNINPNLSSSMNARRSLQPPSNRLSACLNSANEKIIEEDLNLANQILDSLSSSSPSPQKLRRTLSLAERTRMSMSRTPHLPHMDSVEENDFALSPSLSLNPRLSVATEKSCNKTKLDIHTDLVQRTRHSMAGLEASKKKYQAERQKIEKQNRQHERESCHFSKTEADALIPKLDKLDLIEGDPDYESVFMSRPKIKMSPTVSHEISWSDGDPAKHKESEQVESTI